MARQTETLHIILEVELSEEKTKTKGLVVFFISYHKEFQDIFPLKEHVSLFREINADLIKEIEEESNYRVAIVPTVKESCRVEKIDFEDDLRQQFVKQFVEEKKKEESKKEE